MSKPHIYKWGGEWHALDRKKKVRTIADTWQKAYKDYLLIP